MSVTAFRRVAGIAAVAGLSLSGAGAAHAAVDTDCTGVNTVDGASPTAAADIQLLLDASAPLVCVSGTVTLSTPLVASAELTLHGLPGAVLDGANASQILRQTTADTLTVESLRFTRGNNPGANGGAINGPALVIRNSTFDHNSALNGGAVYTNGAATIEGSSFSENFAVNGAGAIELRSGASSTVSNSTFSDNVGGLGGAIRSYGVLAVWASTFDSNIANNAAGAILSNEASIENSTFFANRAANSAGAVVAVSGSIEQSTFVDNFSPAGFGQSAYIGDVSLRGNLFSTFFDDANLYSPDIGTVIDLGGNLFTTDAEPTIAAPAASSQFGLTAAAIFGPSLLASNGGTTQTIAISPTGPAVDAVPAGGVLTTDQRGVTRTALSDAGAFEVGARAALAATGVEPAWPAALAAAVLALGTALRLRRRPARARSLS